MSRVKKGVYVLLEDFHERYEAYKAGSGETFAEERQHAEKIRQRAAWRYYRDLVVAFHRDEDHLRVPVPEGVPDSRVIKARAVVEAGREWMGNAAHRDLLQAAVMVGVEHLCWP